MATKLSAEGYEVEVAETGEEGLERIEAEIPDLLLLDLILPGVDGLEVCRRLRRDNDLPIIVFNLGTPGNIVRAIMGETIGTVVS